MSLTLTQTAAHYLDTLCNHMTNRAVGTEGNRRAVEWFARTIAAFGFTVEYIPFDCMDWSSDGAELTIGRSKYPVASSPYSLGCDVTAPLVSVSTVAELEAAALEARIALLYDEIASGPLMPKNFSFYNPEEHQHIYRLLEAKRPLALITASQPGAMMAGAAYPYPMFEDGDFDIPSVYTTHEVGAQIAAHAGKTVHFLSRAQRCPTTSSSIIARKTGTSPHRIVIMAHIDAKKGTPGALDNGTGIVTLLLLAQALADYAGHHTLEIHAINGEDYYSNPGEMEFLRLNAGQFDSITLGINLDGLGYIEGQTAYSLYECPPALASTVAAAFAGFKGLCEGEQWYAGDHTLLVMQQRPALAFTSEQAAKLVAEIIHTAADTPALVDSARLVEAAQAIQMLIARVDTLTQ